MAIKKAPRSGAPRSGSIGDSEDAEENTESVLPASRARAPLPVNEESPSHEPSQQQSESEDAEQSESRMERVPEADDDDLSYMSESRRAPKVPPSLSAASWQRDEISAEDVSMSRDYSGPSLKIKYPKSFEESTDAESASESEVGASAPSSARAFLKP